MNDQTRTLGAQPQGEREAFEAAISSRPYERSVVRFPDNDSSEWPGSYRDIDVDLAWCMWQARASLSASTPSAVSAEARDAARYRWLRDHAQRRVYHSPLVFAATSGDAPPRWEDAIYGEHLDASVDAHIAAMAPPADNKENGNG